MTMILMIRISITTHWQKSLESRFFMAMPNIASPLTNSRFCYLFSCKILSPNPFLAS